MIDPIEPRTILPSVAPQNRRHEGRAKDRRFEDRLRDEHGDDAESADEPGTPATGSPGGLLRRLQKVGANGRRDGEQGRSIDVFA